MKYIFSLIITILLLFLMVYGIFYSIQKFENFFFGIKKINLPIFEVKNIILTLMENYEKALLGLRNSLEEERQRLLKEISESKVMAERRELQKKLKEVEEMQKKAILDIENTKVEKRELELKIKEREETINTLNNEINRVKKEYLDLKAFWDNYITLIKENLILLRKDRENIEKEFSKEYGKSYLLTLFKELSIKEGDSKILNEKLTKYEEEIKTIKKNYEAALKNLKEISSLLTKENPELTKKLKEISNIKDENLYINKLKDLALDGLKDIIAKTESEKKTISSTIEAKEATAKELIESIEKYKIELEKINSEKNKIVDEKKELEEKLALLQKNIENLQITLLDKEKEIETLLDQTDINGFFISKNNSTIVIINRKKEKEILSVGTFNVYDKNKNIVSKIYVTKEGDRIVATKVPGYNNPVPGNWF